MIEVVIVDGSVRMRGKLAELINKDARLTVVGTAHDGKHALEMIRAHGPDVVFMNIDLPDQTGTATLKDLMKEWPVPTVLYTNNAAMYSSSILEAMAAGAIDFIDLSRGIADTKDALVFKLKAAATARIARYDQSKYGRRHSFSPTRKKVIVIASSTGGPQTLEYLLSRIPKNIPAPILIVQHLPPNFTRDFSERLNGLCELEVKHAQEGDELKDGVVYVAPGGHHMELKLNRGGKAVIALNDEPSELGIRPNANRLFRSVANIFKENTIGVVLTGMGSDGKQGSREIKRYHGTVLAEAEESCVIYGMPKEVIDAGYADAVLPLDKMSVALVQLLEI